MNLLVVLKIRLYICQTDIFSWIYKICRRNGNKLRGFDKLSKVGSLLNSLLQPLSLVSFWGLNDSYLRGGKTLKVFRFLKEKFERPSENLENYCSGNTLEILQENLVPWKKIEVSVAWLLYSTVLFLIKFFYLNFI